MGRLRRRYLSCQVLRRRVGLLFFLSPHLHEGKEVGGGGLKQTLLPLPYTRRKKTRHKRGEGGGVQFSLFPGPPSGGNNNGGARKCATFQLGSDKSQKGKKGVDPKKLLRLFLKKGGKENRNNSLRRRGPAYRAAAAAAAAGERGKSNDMKGGGGGGGAQ